MRAETTLDRVRRYLRQHSARLRAAPSQAEQLSLLAELQAEVVEEAVASLQVVEHRAMQAVRVPAPPQPNGLRHFLDGIQRQRILYYEGVVPVFYAYLAAVVRSRVERRMCCLHEKALRQRDALYAPLRHVDREGLRQHGIPLRDTEAGEPLPPHPALVQLAANRISNDRELIERELAEQWLVQLHQQAGEEWLVVDGGIAEIALPQPDARLVGVAKSSTSVERALTRDQMEVVYGLRQGERSSVLTVLRAGQSPVYSWFLRLHDPKKGSLLYGLLRVEIPASESLLAQVDALSGWLLEDRVPLSVPDTRYDRLLYPMRDCEQFLRARAPSVAQLEALAHLV